VRILGILLCLFAANVQAQMVEVEWTWPVSYTTGEAMPLEDLQGIVLENGPCNSTGTGLVSIDGFIIVPPPAVRATFPTTRLGEACLRAYVTTKLGFNSNSVFVPYTIPEEPAADPNAPGIVRISIVWPVSTRKVVGRLVAGAMTTDNYVYRKATTTKGYIVLGRVAVGSECSCEEGFDAAWPAGAGQYCDVGGNINLGSTSIVPNGTAFPSESWTRCD